MFQFSDKISLLSDFLPIASRSVILKFIKQHSFFYKQLVLKFYSYMAQVLKDIFSFSMGHVYLLPEKECW